ncbi:alpha/beta hydrolase [Salininema proteolyticum]|uniref:Alpha/beta hydrolase n=1 Tax=Salininema proteolyticum TaxID=1607685 RepID=A0ABV8TTG4_9ACTN
MSSSITWETLRDTDFGAFENAADLWSKHLQNNGEIEDRLLRDIAPLKDDDNDEFDGDSADAARTYFRRNADRFAADLEYAEKIKTNLYDAGEWFAERQTDLGDLISRAGSDMTPGGGVGAEEFIVDQGVLDRLEEEAASDPEAERERDELIEKAETLTAEFRELLDGVREYDDELAATFQSIDDEAPSLEKKLSDPSYADSLSDEMGDKAREMAERLENGEATPAEVNEWWDSLDDAERQALADDHPGVIGGMDGIPSDVRDTANRETLGREIEDLDGEIEDLESELESLESEGGWLDDLGDKVGIGDGDREDLRDRIEELRERRDGLEGLQDKIEDPHRVPDGPSQDFFLIDYESAGDGQAVVSIGNPDTADNVNVYVPGTGADLAGASDLIDRSQSMANDAYEADSGAETANVMWLGYDAPDNVAPFQNGAGIKPEAAFQEYAEDGAKPMNSYFDGLSATGRDDATVTATGHSYGTTAIGIAARDEGLDVDNMVFVGSPGVGVDKAEDLGIDPGNVWSSTNSEDVIQYSPEFLHGTDPISDEFGGNTFHSDATRGSGVTSALENHSAYWDERNRSRDNMANIVTGQEEKVGR